MNVLTHPHFMSVFCPVLDVNDNLIGITTELSADVIHLSLPHYFSAESLFPITLINHDVSPPLTVRLILSIIKHSPRNEKYHDIVAKIENPETFKSFFNHFYLASSGYFTD